MDLPMRNSSLLERTHTSATATCRTQVCRQKVDPGLVGTAIWQKGGAGLTEWQKVGPGLGLEQDWRAGSGLVAPPVAVLIANNN
jgi:hypothetical protein